MRRIAALLLLLAFVALASGLPQWTHRRDHDLQHLLSGKDQPASDENPCSLCLALHLPLTGASHAPALVDAGSVPSEIFHCTPGNTTNHPAALLPCRGPPACG